MKLKYIFSGLFVAALTIGLNQLAITIWHKPFGWRFMLVCLAGITINALVEEARKEHGKVHLTINLMLSCGLLAAAATTLTGYSKGYLDILFFVVYGNIGFTYTTLFMVAGALCVFYLILNLATCFQKLYGRSIPTMLRGHSPLNWAGFIATLGYILAWMLYT